MVDEKPEIINPPNALKSKVGTGGPGAVDLDTLEKAEQVIASMADNYLEWVEADLKKISDAYKALAAATGDRKEEIEVVFQISHDMKGQGGSFGFDLVTAIGNELCRMIEKSPRVTDDVVDAVKVHIDAMRLVIQNRMKGDGGANGKAILSGIQQVGDKLTK